MHTQAGVDDGHVVVANLARPDGVVVGLRPAADVAADVLFGLDVGAGHVLVADEGAQRLGLKDPATPAEALD